MKKYLLKIYEKCIMCDGDGQYTYTESNDTSGDNVGSIEVRECHRCNGIGETEIEPSDKRFSKLYKKELEKQINLLLKELREAEVNETQCRKNYHDYIKEYDKIVNK